MMNKNKVIENKTNNKISVTTTILTTIVCLIPVVIGAVMYDKIPEQIAIHWDGAGNPNGWASKFVGVFILPGSIALLNLIFPFLLKMDPKYKNIGSKIKNLLHWTIPMVGLFASGVTLSAALGYDVKIAFFGPVFMGLIFIIVGNYLPKMAQSYTVGIRIPWTLADEENWNKTHRMAGFLWVAAGFIVLIGAFLKINMPICMVIIFIAVFLPIVYSFVLYQKNHKGEE